MMAAWDDKQTWRAKRDVERKHDKEWFALAKAIVAPIEEAEHREGSSSPQEAGGEPSPCSGKRPS
jgi:hypothetical protein